MKQSDNSSSQQTNSIKSKSIDFSVKKADAENKNENNNALNNILLSFQDEFKITNKLLYNINNTFLQFSEKFNSLIEVLQVSNQASQASSAVNNGNEQNINKINNINDINNIENRNSEVLNCILFDKNDLKNSGSFKFLKTDSKYILKPIKNINSLAISNFIGIDDYKRGI
jgi:hypothetical protein